MLDLGRLRPNQDLNAHWRWRQEPASFTPPAATSQNLAAKKAPYPRQSIYTGVRRWEYAGRSIENQLSSSCFVPLPYFSLPPS